jgi:hypothetical protein
MGICRPGLKPGLHRSRHGGAFGRPNRPLPLPLACAAPLPIGPHGTRFEHLAPLEAPLARLPNEDSTEHRAKSTPAEQHKHKPLYLVLLYNLLL